MTQILDGRIVSEKIQNDVQAEVGTMDDKPGLAVVLVGDDPASKAYVGMKKKACEKLGINSFEHRLSPEEGEDKLVQLIHTLNNDSAVNGILVQLPLPKDYDENKIIELIDPLKDVDGFHPVNVGKLLIGLPTLKSCTPAGVIEILKHYDIDPAGKHVVVLGRSNIVGKPISAMLIQKEAGANATLSVCHSRTKNLEQHTLAADIIIAAMGVPYFLKADMVKDGAVIIDVGINRVDDASRERGYKLVGDVDYDAVAEKASAITPVPGGVGPMTIAMLMQNTLKAYRMQRNA